MRFEQAIVGHTIQFFKKGFMGRWGFTGYIDQYKPVVLFGFRNGKYIYENHKSYKIIIPSTTDDLPNFNELKNNEKTILVIDRVKYPNYYIPENVTVKHETIEIKDYSIFRPNVLGNKIYYYSGFKNGWSGRWGEDIIKEIQKNIDYEIITTSHINKNDMYDEKYLKEYFYDKTFLNLNLSKGNGMTTVREMGLMGRKTITMRKDNHYKYNCIVNCESVEEIIKNIKKESKKIGTIQDSMNSHTVGDEWLNVCYWL